MPKYHTGGYDDWQQKVRGAQTGEVDEEDRIYWIQPRLLMSLGIFVCFESSLINLIQSNYTLAIAHA